MEWIVRVLVYLISVLERKCFGGGGGMFSAEFLRSPIVVVFTNALFVLFSTLLLHSPSVFPWAFSYLNDLHQTFFLSNEKNFGVHLLDAILVRAMKRPRLPWWLSSKVYLPRREA